MLQLWRHGSNYPESKRKLVIICSNSYPNIRLQNHLKQNPIPNYVDVCNDPFNTFVLHCYYQDVITLWSFLHSSRRPKWFVKKSWYWHSHSYGGQRPRNDSSSWCVLKGTDERQCCCHMLTKNHRCWFVFCLYLCITRVMLCSRLSWTLIITHPGAEGLIFSISMAYTHLNNLFKCIAL